MTPFLSQVARHYFDRGAIGSVCFIFPNRRAKSFFRKYLSEEVREKSAVPVVAPGMFTMNEFFYKAAGASQTDKVHLLLELHSCYSALMPKAESLDDFIFWGDVLLSDFDDVDKYLVNPRHLFTNVADFKSIQDTYSYLTPAQADAIDRFLKHFRNGSALTVNIQSDNDKDYKAKFLQIWDILFRLYSDFGKRLEEKGMSYEGQVYRRFAERLDSESAVDMLAEAFEGYERFVFVGLNALNECEKKVMRKMRDARIAEFCWDYSSTAIKDPHNKSSLFMSANVNEFPQAFEPDPEGLPRPEFNVISVPSGIGQVKQIPAVLEKLSPDPGIETAIVLPDEELLIPALNSIPENISDLNVTMGYPMGGSELWSLIGDVSALQMHLRQKDGVWMFYHKQVRAIFSNSIIKTVASENARATMDRIRSDAKYYIPQDDFAGDGLLSLIFRPVVTNAAEASAEMSVSIGAYLQELLSGIAPLLKDNAEMAVEMDFAREYWLAAARLKTCSLPVLPATYFRLLSQLVAGSSVPFHGEPLNGLQIMGPLETRALDFENIIILSCNEGMFPRRSVSSSFIPAELRKGFGLPTYEFQDSVWAYYFYRLIQRASKVWMVFDSRSEGLHGGEQSRYIRQLELHFGEKVTHYVVKAPISHTDEETEIGKTPEHIAALKGKYLSASALQNYLSCPAKFYYHSVCGLREDEEVAESLDAGMLGNVFHKTMHDLYDKRAKIEDACLATLIEDGGAIRSTVEKHIKEELHTFEITGRNIIFEDVVISYVRKALERDREYLKACGTDSFRILGLERKFISAIDGFNFIGFVDRLDSFKPGEIRVVDYKTGKVTDEDFKIDENNAESIVEDLFGEDNSKRPKIALQLYLYDRFVRESGEFEGSGILNSIYQTSRLFIKEVENVALNEKFCTLMDGRLSALLAEIADTQRPWKRTEDAKTCEYCDFKMICGR